MNVKIDKTGLRFKVSAEELAELAAGKAIREELQVAENVLVIEIDPVGVDGALEPFYDKGLVGLKVAPAKIRKLLEMGRSRAGLEGVYKGICVSLQVDIRTQKRQKRAD